MTFSGSWNASSRGGSRVSSLLLPCRVPAAVCSHCQVRGPAQADAVSWHNSPFALKLKSVPLPLPSSSLLPPPDSCSPTRAQAGLDQGPGVSTPSAAAWCTHQFSLGKRCGLHRRRGLGQTLTQDSSRTWSLFGDGLGVQTLMSQTGQHRPRQLCGAQRRSLDGPSYTPTSLTFCLSLGLRGPSSGDCRLPSL